MFFTVYFWKCPLSFKNTYTPLNSITLLGLPIGHFAMTEKHGLSAMPSLGIATAPRFVKVVWLKEEQNTVTSTCGTVTSGHQVLDTSPKLMMQHIKELPIPSAPITASLVGNLGHAYAISYM